QFLAYLHNAEDAEEATQDVFLKVFRKMERFRQESALRTWIYRITVNQCLDILKSRKRQKRFGINISLFRADGELQDQLVPDFEHPGVQLEDREAVQAIFRQLDALPNKQRTALILKTLEGLSQQEIAQVMRLSTKAVESLLSRARASLKKKLSAGEGTAGIYRPTTQE
ncbi:MAG: RNA polymerase sigma factor, partial [Bacteroidota bacterium]